MSIIKIDPVFDKRWDDFVFQHPEGTIFHHSSWAKVLQNRYRTEPSYFAMEDGKKEITAIAPFFLIPNTLGGKRLVCLPCAEYCFPLGNNPDDVSKLIMFARNEVENKRLFHMEIRGANNNLKSQDNQLMEHPYYLNHVAILDGNIQDFKSRLSRDTRYHLNRGERSQVKIRLGQNEHDLKIFHSLTSQMRRRINLLPWPYRFFQSIYKHLILEGHGYLLLAIVDDNIVSGGMFFCFKDRVVNKFNASDVKYIQNRPNYLVMWKAIEMAYENSFRYFDFGITNPENTGLIKFKGHWNTRQSILPYYYYPDRRGTSSIPETSFVYRLHTNINRIMPSLALKLVSDLLYKRLG